MTEPDPLPGRTVEPLPPPPGGFDLVVSRARERRGRQLRTATSVSAVFLAGILGGLALGGLPDVPQRVIALATGNTPPTSTATVTTTTEAVGVPTATRAPRTRSAPTTSAPAPSAPVPVAPSSAAATTTAPALVRGRVLDPDGGPVAGMYVYTGTFTDTGFAPDRTEAAVTGPRGGYDVPCTGGPLLLTSWRLNTPLGGSAPGRWAATYVAAPVCARDEPRAETVVQPGGTVEGQVSTDLGCADATFALPLLLGGNPAASVRLTGLHEGDAYRISGLPKGTHQIGPAGDPVLVTLAAGATVTQDLTFRCPDQPVPSTTPTGSPSPAPTPSETDSPPAGSATPTSGATRAAAARG